MNIMSFNIRCCDDPQGHTIAERAPRLLRILERCDADIIGLQEVRPQWEGILTAALEKEYAWFLQYRDPGDNPYREGSPILWKREKFTCIDKGCFWFSDIPWVMSEGYDELYHCRRICQWVHLEEKATGKRFHYANLHLGFGDDSQVKSVRLLQKTMALLGADTLFVTGDFNMHPDSPGYAEMTKTYTDVNRVTARYEGPTFHAYGEESKMEHIDYCFITPKTVQADSWALLDDTMDGKYPSDHYGILCRLTVK